MYIMNAERQKFNFTTDAGFVSENVGRGPI